MLWAIIWASMLGVTGQHGRVAAQQVDPAMLAAMIVVREHGSAVARARGDGR